MGRLGSAFTQLDEVLRARGFALVEDVNYPQAFGSRYADYRRGVERIRLIWDGKEEWLVLQHARPGDAWRDLCVQRVGRGTAGETHIQALVHSLDQIS